MKNATPNQYMDDFRGHIFAIYGCIEVMILLPALYNQLLSIILKGQPYESNILLMLACENRHAFNEKRQ